MARDAFTAVLEGLREEDFRRLRVFHADGRASFRTWLAVVSRRLCRDFLRSRYGRHREAGDEPRLQARARLVDLVGEEMDLDGLTALSPGPEGRLRRKELNAALDRVLGELPSEDRLLLALRFEDGVPVREIRATLNLPSVFHVYRRLRKALARVRDALAHAGIEDPEP